jgi:hypothetical protein
MYQKLHFRRQFLLTIAPIIPPNDWQCLRIHQYYLYAHPDLEINQLADHVKTIVLLGDIYDSEDPQKGNADILGDIMASTNSMEGFVAKIKRYAGTYAFLFKDDKDAIILNDARALKEIYYCTKNNQIVCGSQPNLVAKYSNPEIKPTSDPDLLDFYKHHLWDSRWIGDETYYDGIKHLLPNHYLNINRREAHRYWPNESIKRLNLDEAVTKSCSLLRGIMRSIVNRHPVMMAITSGTDSRTLLAASRGLHEKIYFFINNHNLGNKHPDIAVPRKILKRIGVPFYVHDVPKEVDDEFRKIFFNNTFLAAERILPSIYNVFFKNHGEKILILGVSEIGRTFYGKEPRNLNSYRMAYKLGYKNCLYLDKQCKQLLAEMLPIVKKFGMNFWDLLYWEQRLGNWGATRNSESAIAIEKVDPYNCRLLFEIFLGVDEKYRDYRHTPCIFFREMIQSMWAELLAWPINPPYTVRDKISWVLEKTGFFQFLKELKYQVHYSKYKVLNKWRK